MQALFSIHNDFPGIASDDFVSRSGSFSNHSTSQWIPPKFESDSGSNLSTPILFNIIANEYFLYVKLDNTAPKLCSGAPDPNDPSAQFIITTPNPEDPSYIEIATTAFANLRIVAADFSNNSQSLIIVS